MNGYVIVENAKNEPVAVSRPYQTHTEACFYLKKSYSVDAIHEKQVRVHYLDNEDNLFRDYPY